MFGDKNGSFLAKRPNRFGCVVAPIRIRFQLLPKKSLLLSEHISKKMLGDRKKKKNQGEKSQNSLFLTLERNINQFVAEKKNVRIFSVLSISISNGFGSLLFSLPKKD